MAETKKKTTTKKTTSKPAKKETKSTTTTSTSTSSSNNTSKRSWSSTKVLDFIAYFAIIFIAIATILQLCLSNHQNISGTFQNIGQSLAYIICIWLGFYWVMRKIRNNINKRNVWWLVGWIVATVVIVIVYIVWWANLPY